MENTEKIMNNNDAYIDYVENFKCMLVKRYFWSVTDAYNFNSDELEQCFKDGLDKYDAYFKIFNVEPDLQN